MCTCTASEKRKKKHIHNCVCVRRNLSSFVVWFRFKRKHMHLELRKRKAISVWGNFFGFSFFKWWTNKKWFIQKICVLANLNIILHMVVEAPAFFLTQWVFSVCCCFLFIRPFGTRSMHKHEYVCLLLSTLSMSVRHQWTIFQKRLTLTQNSACGRSVKVQKPLFIRKFGKITDLWANERFTNWEEKKRFVSVRFWVEQLVNRLKLKRRKKMCQCLDDASYPFTRTCWHFGGNKSAKKSDKNGQIPSLNQTFMCLRSMQTKQYAIATESFTSFFYK